MNRCSFIIGFWCVSFLLLSHTCMAQMMWQVSASKVVSWYYYDGDEFTGMKLDTSKWLNTYPWGRSLYCNREQQFYTNNKNLEVENGFLKLIAKNETVSDKILHWEQNDFVLKCEQQEMGKNFRTFNYTSGMIYSTKKYQYGYFEMRFKVDKGRGLWPAFWLYAGKDNNEIDIFEIKGERNSDLHIDMHCPNGCDNYKTTFGVMKKNWGDFISTNGGWHDGFNCISAEWTPDHIIWYLNGKGIAYWKGKMDSPSAVIANMALPSNNGPFGPGPDATTNFPATFMIDYIRIWTSNPTEKKSLLLEPVLPGSERATFISGKSKITRKTKPEYKKSVLKNEIVNVTFSPIPNNGYMIAFSSKPVGIFELEVKDENQKIIYQSADSKTLEHHFYVKEGIGKSSLKIIVNGQKIDYQF